jgi:hypothetical protein
MDVETKLIENRQTLLTRADAQRLDWLAETEGRKVSEMMRVLILEGLERWEKSAPGRRRKRA